MNIYSQFCDTIPVIKILAIIAAQTCCFYDSAFMIQPSCRVKNNRFGAPVHSRTT